MSIAEMRQELISRIADMDGAEIEETYGLLLNNYNSKIDDWDTLPPYMRQKIEQGLKEIENGKVFSLESVVNEARSKYGRK